MTEMELFKADFVKAVKPLIEKHIKDAGNDTEFLAEQAFGTVLNVMYIIANVKSGEVGK